MADQDITWIYEFIDKESPGEMTLAPGQSEATLFFIVKWERLYDIVTEIMGYTKVSSELNGVGNQSLGFDRKIPLQHPRFPYLYAESIKIQGVSSNGAYPAELFTYPEYIYRNTEDPDSVQVDYKTFENQLVFKEIKLAVKFTARNYFLLTNEQLQIAINDPDNGNLPRRYYYWEKDKTRVVGKKSANYFDMREYLRYTELFVEPGNEIIANTNGKFYWKSETLDGPVPNAPKTNSPVTIENASVNFSNITKNVIKIKWYQIPKILFQPSETGTYKPWDYAVSMVNYGANYDSENENTPPNVEVFNYDFFQFAPGTLLYLGYELEDASSPFPFLPMFGDAATLPINYLQNQYYNVVFTFAQFVIPNDQLILPNIALVPNRFGKMYSNGWNFITNPNRNFYYIESDVSTNNLAIPPYWSFPFQAIFNPRLEITA